MDKRQRKIIAESGFASAYAAWSGMAVYIVAQVWEVSFFRIEFVLAGSLGLFFYLNAKRGINSYRPPITLPVSINTILEVCGLLGIVLVWLLVLDRPLTLKNILEHTIGFALAGWLLSAILRSTVRFSSRSEK